MLSILIIFRAQHFFRVRIWANAGQYIVIFITFRVYEFQLQKVPLNGNKKGGGFRGVQRVEKCVLS